MAIAMSNDDIRSPQTLALGCFTAIIIDMHFNDSFRHIGLGTKLVPIHIGILCRLGYYYFRDF